MIEQYGLGIFVILIFVVLPMFLGFGFIVWLFFDITKERQKFKQELKESQKKWRKL